MKVRIVEHKTSSEDIEQGSTYWQKLTLDGQLSTYFVGARALGYEPVDVLYDVAKRPTLRPLKATPLESRKVKKDGTLYANQREHDETPEEYRVRVHEDIAADPAKYYQRGRVVRLASEEAAAAKNTWILGRWIREVQLESRHDSEAWPQNVDACHVYNSTCDFWGVCAGQASLEDPNRYRRVEDAHEELAPADGKRRLPLLTISSVKTFRSCPRKYYFRYELGYRTVAASEALRFGTLFHRGLEAWWQTANLEEGIAAIRSGVAADEFERVKAEELLVGYHLRWIDESLTVLKVEAEFTAPLVNPATGAESKTWALGGKIDAIVSAEPNEARHVA